MVYNRVLKTKHEYKCIQYDIAICEYELGNVYTYLDI